MLIPDIPGHGLSGKPDRRYGIRWFADCMQGAMAALGVEEVDLLTHDIGDSIGGELLARSLEGTLPFRVRRRVLTNGSIYMDLVQLSDGQQLLLSLPDEPTDLITKDAWIAGLRGTFGPDSIVDDDELEVLWHFTAHDGGQRMLTRAIRYIEDRRAEERRYTEPIEIHPSPLGVVWGALDPIAVVAMAERLVSVRPDAPTGGAARRRALPDARGARPASAVPCCDFLDGDLSAHSFGGCPPTRRRSPPPPRPARGSRRPRSPSTASSRPSSSTRPTSLRELFDALRAKGDALFLVYEDERWTFERFMAEVDALAAGLVGDLGVRPGDRVGIAMRNLPEWVVGFAAAVSIGAISVSLNGWWTAEELDFALEDSSPRVLLADPERAERAGGVVRTAGHPARGRPGRRAPCRRAPAGGRTWWWPGAAMPDVAVAPDADATILYTSGHHRQPEGRGVDPPGDPPGPRRVPVPVGRRPDAQPRGRQGDGRATAGVHPRRPAVPRDRLRVGAAVVRRAPA